MHNTIIIFARFIYSPCGCLEPFFSHCWTFQLPWWLQDLPAETCRSGQFHLSYSAEVIPETSSCCLRCQWVQFVFRSCSSLQRHSFLLALRCRRHFLLAKCPRRRRAKRNGCFCRLKSQLRADLRTLVKKSLHCLCIYYMKTQKFKTKCRVCRDSRFKAYHTI